MTNKEITIEICKIMGYNYEVDGDAVLMARGKSTGNIIYLQSVFDPCGVAGDADPIIEHFKVSTVWNSNHKCWTCHCGPVEASGQNRLELAMRAVVAYNLNSVESFK